MLDTLFIMQVGQVGFHKQGDVLKVKAVEKKGDILKKINKTLVEAHPDLEEQRKEYDRRIAKESKRQAQACSNLQMHVLKGVHNRTFKYPCAYDISLWRHGWHNQVIKCTTRHASSVLSVLQIKRVEEKELIEKKRKKTEDRSYVTMMDADEMQSNKDMANKYVSVEDMEDDFM
jgi:hypothetical protein